MTEELHEVRLKVNGVTHELRVPARRLLSDALRHDLGLTGTHVGCEHGVCGACTVLVDGRPKLSCITLALTAQGRKVTTIEGLAKGGQVHKVQDAFDLCGALQCGFCQSGMMLSAAALLEKNPQPNRAEIKEALAGNLCRCTGYTQIITAVEVAAGLRKVPERDERPTTRGGTT